MSALCKYFNTFKVTFLNKHRIKLKYDMKIKYATIDGLLCIEYTKFIKGQTSMT